MPRGKGGVRPLRPSWGTVVKFQSHAVFGVSVTQSWGTSMASSPSLLGVRGESVICGHLTARETR